MTTIIATTSYQFFLSRIRENTQTSLKQKMCDILAHKVELGGEFKLTKKLGKKNHFQEDKALKIKFLSQNQESP